MNYKVNYDYFGKGFVLIEAESSKEAEEKYYDGDYLVETECEDGYSYEITGVEEADALPF